MAKKRLPKKLHAAITKLCEEGDAFAEEGDDQAAYKKYEEAWNLVPEEKARELLKP